MKFQWDERKAEKNQLKHGVAFEEAITVFEDLSTLISMTQTILKTRNVI
jgi:uncharacterized DUF497 family protein